MCSLHTAYYHWYVCVYFTIKFYIIVGAPFSNSLFSYNDVLDGQFANVNDGSDFVRTFTTPYILYGNSYQDVYVSIKRDDHSTQVYVFDLSRLVQMGRYHLEQAPAAVAIEPFLHSLH